MCLCTTNVHVCVCLCESLYVRTYFEPWLCHRQQPFPIASLISGQLTTPPEELAEIYKSPMRVVKIYLWCIVLLILCHVVLRSVSVSHVTSVTYIDAGLSIFACILKNP